jgi:hypothetical protein
VTRAQPKLEAVTADEFIAALLPRSPKTPKLGDVCAVVSSPFVKGTSKQFPPVVYHAGATYGPELYVNWATCRVVEFTNKNGDTVHDVRASNAAFVAQHFLMLDDIGDPEKSELTLDDACVKKATYLLETSEDNYQVGFKLKTPLDATQCAQLRAACIEAGLADKGSLGSSQRWCRVPGSVNVKPGRGNWRARLRAWHPGRAFTFEQLCVLLDLTIDERIEGPNASTGVLPDDIEKYNDAHFRWMRSLPRGAPGSLIGGRSAQGFFDILCPWVDDHSDGDTSGTGYRPGFGDNPPSFKCHHSHGVDISTNDFIEWCIAQQNGEEEEPEEEEDAEPFFNVGAVLDSPYPDWLIDDLFARRQVGAIYGESWAGKSTLAFAFTMALTGSAKVLGDLDQWEENCAAVYYALEGNLRTRVEPYIAEGLLKKMPNVRYERELRLSTDLSTFDEVAAQLEKAESLVGDRLALVVIDTLARAGSDIDENSADMGVLAEECRKLAEAFDVCVLLVHHTGKDASKGMRGHSSLQAALDFAILVEMVELDGQVQRTFTVTKQREGLGRMTRAFEIAGVELGTHPKRPQKVVTGPLAYVRGGEVERPTKKQLQKQPSGANQKVVWRVLSGLLRKTSRHPRAVQLAQGWAVPVDLLVEQVATQLTGDRKPARANQALQALVGDWVALVDDVGTQLVVSLRPADDEEPA